MDKLVVNESNINNYDSYMKKARAIVLNEKNEIYICNMNNTYLLPGGTVEDNESTFQTLIRELKEELGLNDFEDVYELINIEYYHDQFPKYKSDGFDKRLNSVFYYVVNVSSNDIGESHFTEYESIYNSKIEVIKLNEVEKLFQNPNVNNKWQKFNDLELKVIFEYFNDMRKREDPENKSYKYI